AHHSPVPPEAPAGPAARFRPDLPAAVTWARAWWRFRPWSIGTRLRWSWLIHRSPRPDAAVPDAITRWAAAGTGPPVRPRGSARTPGPGTRSPRSSRPATLSPASMRWPVAWRMAAWAGCTWPGTTTFRTAGSY